MRTDLNERVANLLTNYGDLVCYNYLLRLVLQDDGTQSYHCSDVGQRALDTTAGFVAQKVEEMKYDLKHVVSAIDTNV